MATVIDWPAVLKPARITLPVLEKNIASAGVSLTGQERFIATDAGRWVYGISVPLRSRSAVMAWRGLLAQTEGRQFLIRVPFCDCQYDPATLAGIRHTLAAGGTLTHSDDTTFSDGTGYAAALVTATVDEAAVEGATSISVTMPTGLVPESGHFFSDGDRAYQVKTATLTSGTSYDLTFRPRLRADIAEGAEVSFDRIHCLMRLADDVMQFTDLDLMRFGQLDLQFLEALL